MHCYCSPCQCVLLLLFLVIMHYCSFCQCVLLLMFIVIMCYYWSMGPCWCALLPLPKYLYDLLLLLSFLLLCATIIPLCCSCGSTPSIWYYTPSLLLCKWRRRTKKLQTQIFSMWIFLPLFFFKYYFVCIIVCVLWICMYLDFFCCICFVC
jgi:hypothetical protein